LLDWALGGVLASSQLALPIEASPQSASASG